MPWCSVTNAPIGGAITGVLNVGTPKPSAFDPALLVTCEYPLGSGQFLSVNGAGAISSSPTEGDHERFRESNHVGTPDDRNVGMLYGMRDNTPIQLGITYGLVG